MDFTGFEKFSLVDFDDMIGSTLFVSHCNFRCPFCHNGLLVLGQNLPTIKFDDILKYFKEENKMIEAVCISGGEPTLMPDLEEKLIELKKLGLFIKLDTNGTNPNVIESLHKKGLIDYVAMDIKNSLDNYDTISGIKNVDISKIKKSINYLMTSGIEYEFRTTLIKEYHKEEDIIKIANDLKGAKKYYLQKFVDSEYVILHGLHEVSEDEANKWKEILSKTIQNVNLRGY